MSENNSKYVEDTSTRLAREENILILAEKSGNVQHIANTYVSELLQEKALKAKKEKNEDISRVIARQQLEAMLDRLDEIAKRLGEIADEIDKTAKELEALRALKKLELAGKLDPNNPEHALLFQQAGIGVNDSIDDAINDRISYMQQLHDEYDSLIAEEQQINQTIQKNYPNLATDHPEYKKIYEQKRNELLQKVKTIDKKFETKGVDIEDARIAFRQKNNGNSILFEDANHEYFDDDYNVASTNKIDNSDPFAAVGDKTTSFANTVDTDDHFVDTANISDPFNEVATVLTEQEKTLHIENKVETNLNQSISNPTMK
jgi:hypothetical protein